MYTINRQGERNQHGSARSARFSHKSRVPLTLQDRLFSILQRSQHNGEKDFFPRVELDRLITEQCVYEELSRQLDTNAYGREEIFKIAKDVCQETVLDEEENSNKQKIRSFRKLFVVLVLINKTSAIIKFLANDINDSDLPLVKVLRQHKKNSYTLRLSREPDRRLRCFGRSWDQLHIRNFDEYQWKTLSPFFSRGGHKEVKHYKFQKEVILPFLETSGEKSSLTDCELSLKGGFGTISKIHIHPQHHNFRNTDDTKVKVNDPLKVDVLTDHRSRLNTMLSNVLSPRMSRNLRMRSRCLKSSAILQKITSYPYSPRTNNEANIT